VTGNLIVDSRILKPPERRPTGRGLTMPKMTGDEMARQIKAIPSDIPIILCSGFNDRIPAQAMEAIGIGAVLMKPVTYVDLAHTVRQVLGTHS
jgi:two-component system, cell cycle sensor histidine kinase and response regulator CckA